MTEINKIAIIGSGVMGASIAAHVANSGTEVLLFDIVPDGANDRSGLAKSAIEKLLKTDPAPLIHKRKAKLITPCNLEDDLGKLADVDWIIEVVIERLDIKHDLYKKLDAHRKKGSVISSNTSTLPLHKLVEGMSDEFKNDFMITHFFNPPRYMRLLELVTGDASSDKVAAVRQFCDVKLGKGVIDCKDTPGFIANRIGIYWIANAIHHAFETGISVEEADLIMSRPVGIPKTGVFGLMDLIGIDLLPLIAKSFADTLDSNDEFFKIYKDHDLIKKMIEDGYTGRKGKGGFYRLNTDNGGKVKEVIDLKTGEYSAASRPSLKSANAAKGGLQKMFETEDIGGKYGWAVLRDVLHYAASLIPEISDDIVSVDDAMKMGYNWKYGPFELIDKIGVKYFVEKLKEEGLEVPAILEKAGNGKLYKQTDVATQYLTLSGVYQDIKVADDAFMLADKKRGQKPIIKNGSASLWDIGDGVACLEFTSKMNSLDPDSLTLIAKATEIVKENYKGLVIYNDSDNFCVGANIGVLLFAANTACWNIISDIIKQGQDTYMGLKYAPFPVVSAPSGMALGGGCEMLLHSDAVAAHVELYTGLVEVGVGVVPGWGGCKEMVYRQLAKRAKADSIAAKLGGMFSFISPVKTINTMPALQDAFMNISMAKVAKSAEEASDMLILNEKSRITMNRKRLLPDAKALCLELAEDYVAPQTNSISLPGKTGMKAFEMGIRNFEKSGKATPHDVTVSKAVARVLTGGETDITKELTEQEVLDLEREEFDKLVKDEKTLARIEHMLEKGKPLRN